MKTITRNVSMCGVLALLWSMAVSWGGTNGYVQVWGTSDYGMQEVPAAALSNTTALAAGWHHCMALANGRVYAWGDGESGQTSVDPNAVAGVAAIAAGAKSSAALKNGQIVLWGKAEETSKQVAFETIPANGPYKAVALGANHGLAIRDDGNGTVDAWGDDGVGQVYQTAFWGGGLKAVAAGKEFSMGLNELGQVFVAGNPKNGDGDDLKINEIPPEATNGVSAIAAGPYHAMALKDGRVWVWGAWKAEDIIPDIPQPRSARAAYGDVTNVPESAKSGVVQIAAGMNTCAALKEDGSIVVWGNDAGSGSVKEIPLCATNNVKEIVLGYRHAMARTSYLPPTLTSTSLPDAYLESEYDGQVTAIGDPNPTFYVKGALQLPNGLALDSATGAITGVPTKEGTNHVTIAATNRYGEDSRQFTIVVQPRKTAAPTWITESLPAAVVGTWYEEQLQATESPVYSVDPNLEPLPDWATLTPDGILKGWPEGVGDAYPTFIAANEMGSTNRQLKLSTVNPTTVPVISGQGALPDGVKGTAYSVVLGIQGASDVSLSSGRLPAGLVLQGTNGTWRIEGNPTTTGEEQEFELAASNPAGTSKGTWSIAVKGPPEWVTPEGALQSGRVGMAYTATVEANWATNYVKASAWPAGWTVSLKDGSTGKIAQISATPTATTNVSLGLTAVNAHGSTTPVRYFTVSVLDSSVPELSWTGIHCASNAVSLTWTNKTGGDSTAWVGTTTNLLSGWPTNAALAPPDWLKTNSPATLPATSGPHFYLLRAP
jgi:alpha-tubulin suppressor-like RCC1 family protein